MRNLESRVQRLEAAGKEETIMIVSVDPGQSKDEAIEVYFAEHPEMRNYSGLSPFLFVKMFQEKKDA